MAQREASDLIETPAIYTAGWQVRLIQLLAVPGVVVAYYLWLFHQGQVFPSCAAGSWFDCGQVSGPAAPYASLGGIPVALIGLAGYLTIFLITWLREWLPVIEDNLPELLVGVVGLGFVFTLFLTGLEAFVIHSFCQYCLVSAGIITVMFLLALSYLRDTRRGTGRA
jgi:uncharacterized membrane protein